MGNVLSVAWAVVCQRCPECRAGKVFRRLMTMNERCPVCGLRFERDPGYFYGAMYLSYMIAFLSTSYWIVLLVMGVNPFVVVALPGDPDHPHDPADVPDSRVAWLAIDHWFDPGYETKWRDEPALEPLDSARGPGDTESP